MNFNRTTNGLSYLFQCVTTALFNSLEPTAAPCKK